MTERSPSPKNQLRRLLWKYSEVLAAGAATATVGAITATILFAAKLPGELRTMRAELSEMRKEITEAREAMVSRDCLRMSDEEFRNSTKLCGEAFRASGVVRTFTAPPLPGPRR
jgi:hypothetical protein